MTTQRQLRSLQGGPIKSKPLPNDQKIVLKPVDEIRFIRQIKV